MLELNRIYQGDCLTLMKEMPDKSVDLVLTDPPYSEKTHVGMRSMSKDGHAATSIDFDSIDESELRIIFNEIGRVSKAWIVSFIDWRHAAILEEHPPNNLDFVRLGIWVKPNGMPQLTADRPSMGWEAIAFLHRSDKKKEWNGGGSSSVFTHNNVRAGRFVANFHPTEKPLGLVQELLDLFSKPGDIVLDPFCGSGTTAIACKMTGRNYIAMEKDKKYYDVALERIERVNNHKLTEWFE